MTGRAGRLARAAGTAAATGVAAQALYRTLRRCPPGGTDAWSRTNHRGEQVTLLEGPAVAAAAALASALAPGLPVRTRAALAAAVTGAAAFGGYDDLAGSGDRRGFRGHLGALARGEVTTGTVKLAGIGSTGLAAAVLAGGTPADVMVNAGLVAGSANLLNLFDLRPGRAVKAWMMGAGLLAAAARAAPSGGPRVAAAVAGPLGAALALLPDDLGERAMLGDAGANALGALLGTAAAVAMSRRARVMALAGIAGLTAASEVVSFTAVIERTPALRRIDMLGRRPVSARPGRESPGRARPEGVGQGHGKARRAWPVSTREADPSTTAISP